MRYLTILLLTFLSSTAFANQPGHSATGPNVMCEFGSGDVKYIPVVICKHSGGKVVH